MLAYDPALHFNQGAKEVTFLLGDAEFPQRATLAIMQRVEERFGPAFTLVERLRKRDVTVRELLELLALILRDREGVPKGAALAAAVEPVGVAETIAACVVWLCYGLASDMPSEGKREGNA